MLSERPVLLWSHNQVLIKSGRTGSCICVETFLENVSCKERMDRRTIRPWSIRLLYQCWSNPLRLKP